MRPAASSTNQLDKNKADMHGTNIFHLSTQFLLHTQTQSGNNIYRNHLVNIVHRSVVCLCVCQTKRTKSEFKLNQTRWEIYIYIYFPQDTKIYRDNTIINLIPKFTIRIYLLCMYIWRNSTHRNKENHKQTLKKIFTYKVINISASALNPRTYNNQSVQCTLNSMLQLINV